MATAINVHISINSNVAVITDVIDSKICFLQSSEYEGATAFKEISEAERQKKFKKCNGKRAQEFNDIAPENECISQVVVIRKCIQPTTFYCLYSLPFSPSERGK